MIPKELQSFPRLAALVGPAGIGKTQFCLENFSRLLQENKNPFSQDLLYILPTAEHRERIIDLILRKNMSGFLGERVVTLNRLMQGLLKAGDFYLATDAERRFLLRDILSQQTSGYFSTVREFPGFIEKTADFIGEMKESMVSLPNFREKISRLKKARPELADKYQSLLEIYEAYENRLEGLNLKDHRDGIFLLEGQEKRPKFRHLFIDGFFDFSLSQLGFLKWLAGCSDRITLTLSMDLSPERKTLFQIPGTTLKDLEKIGFEIVDFSKKENQRTSAAGLRHAERNLFSPHPSPLPEGEGDKVQPSPSQGEGRVRVDSFLILEATGIRGEVEMIARQIRKIIRAERLNFSDVAVILRRVGEYESIIRTVFRQFGIPVEIHERERLGDAPLARTLASFFKILLRDWRREDLFNFLKSSYVETDYQEVCRLEMRALDLGILSGRERWQKEMGDPLFEKISRFQDRFSGEHSVDEFIRFTGEVIEGFALNQIPRIYEATARRDFATLTRLRSLLEEIRRGRAQPGAKQLFDYFAQEFLGLIEVDLFSLHERDKNLVQVYDVSLARQKEYKVVFIAGLLEKYFPVEVREDPILSDEERRLVGLQEKLPRQALERYLFYIALTRAREKVILTYPRFDLEGHEALPSFYVDEIQRLFTTPIPKHSYPVSQSLPALEDVVEEREVQAHLVRRLWQRGLRNERSQRALTLALYNHFIEKESFQVFVRRLLFEPVARITDEAVRKAFLPKDEIFKPTGLETYGKCPYRYFASHVLQLEEKEEGIPATLAGTLLHEVLDCYWKERVTEGKKELADLETAKSFVKNKLEELMKEKPLSGDRRYRIELKIANMQDWLIGMIEKEIIHGSPLAPLRPGHFEYEFGFRKDYLKLHDPFREDLKLRGKIDRIDVDPSGKYALVIDYKTGAEFKQSSLDFGIALQLPLYLIAAQQRLGLKPLGGQIYTINKAQAKGFYLKDATTELGIDLGRQSAFERKDFDQMIQRVVAFCFKYAEGIRKAEIPVKPRDCDNFCAFPSVCRIEKWKLRLIEREIMEEDKGK